MLTGNRDSNKFRKILLFLFPSSKDCRVMFVPVTPLKFGTLSDYLEHLCKNRNTLSPPNPCSLLRDFGNSLTPKFAPNNDPKANINPGIINTLVESAIT